MIDQRKAHDQGVELTRAVNDSIHKQRITGAELALLSGKADSTVSCILAERHPAGWSIADQAWLYPRLGSGGAECLKLLCSFFGKYPAELPHGKGNGAGIMGTTGALLKTIEDAIADGELTLKEIWQIRSRLVDQICAIDNLIGQHVGKL